MPSSSPLKGLFLLDASAYEEIYGEEARRAIAELVELVAPPQTGAPLQKTPSVERPTRGRKINPHRIQAA